MDIQQEKDNRNNYLELIYTTAKEHSPTSPTSVYFGLSKYGKLKDGKVEMDEIKSGGYLLGETLSLSKTEVEAIVIHCHERGLLDATLGLKKFRLTNEGVDYVESL